MPPGQVSLPPGVLSPPCSARFSQASHWPEGVKRPGSGCQSGGFAPGSVHSGCAASGLPNVGGEGQKGGTQGLRLFPSLWGTTIQYWEMVGEGLPQVTPSPLQVLDLSFPSGV